MGSWKHERPSLRQAPAERFRGGDVPRVGDPDGLIAQGVSNALASRFVASVRDRPAPPVLSRGRSENVLARDWQKKPQKTGGRGINTASSTVKKRLLALVPKMKIVEDGQMAKDPDDKTWRIDYQGPSHGPSGEDYASMAAQVGSATFASCHCPANWGIEARQGGMAEAITRNDAIWWVPEAAVEEEEVKKPKPQKGGGGGKGGGGKKGQFGSRGGKQVKV